MGGGPSTGPAPKDFSDDFPDDLPDDFPDFPDDLPEPLRRGDLAGFVGVSVVAREVVFLGPYIPNASSVLTRSSVSTTRTGVAGGASRTGSAPTVLFDAFR